MPDLQERLTVGLADRYAVKSEVGHGGAVVFLAEVLRHHRQVAIKVHSSERSRQPRDA